MSDFSRRRFVYGTGAAIAAGALAGCSGDGENGGDGGNNSGDGGGNGGGGGELESWLDEQEANAWEGSLEDHTGEDEVTVSVGGGNGVAFDPPGITIDAGTTVVWEWTGQGGGHNVVPTDQSDFSEFGTDQVTEEEGHTVENTFDESGEARYVCEPHRAQGMVGGILVK